MSGTIPSEVNLEACLFGGQAFTWWREQETLHGLARGTRVHIDEASGRWRATPSRDATFLPSYLGAQRPRPEDLLDDPDIGPLAEALPGLRLLNQDPWEAFVSFLITPVNNVPRIQETIARMSRALGPTLHGAHALPRPEDVAASTEERLRELGLGFRAPRVLTAANAVEEGRLDLDGLSKAPIEVARERLLELDGVGPKVAECLLCYSLGFDEAFPVDRWVARASKAVLGHEIDAPRARKRWGQHAAIVQQLLFHAARTGLVDGIEASSVARFEEWRALVGTPEPSTTP